MSRKGNGEGTIRKKGKGFEARLVMPDGSRPSVYGATRREVLDKLRELQTLRAQGRSLGTADQTVEGYLYHWLSTMSRKHQFSVTTSEAYEKRIRWIVPYVGSMKINRLKPAHIDETYAAMMDGGLAARTVFSLHGTMRQAFEHAVSRDQLAVNPFNLVKAPRPEKHEMKVLTEDQLRRLWSANQDDPWYPLWVVLGTTGIRLGEALALRWVFVTPKTISVVNSLHPERGKGMVLGPTKNKSSERTLDIVPFCAEAFAMQRDALPVRLIDREADFVFRNAAGLPYRHEKARLAFFRALAHAGLPLIRVHDLRHTYATLLLEKRVPVHKVARILGHTNANITSTVYSHVTKQMDDDAIAATLSITAG